MASSEGPTHDINPQITSIKHGVRNLKEITIYPLSIGDQKKMSNLITKGIEMFMEFSDGGSENVKVVNSIVETIESNLANILNLITDDDVNSEELMDDMTNNQAGDLAILIFEMNYKDLIKKVKGLLESIGLSPSEQLFPSSVENLEDTDSTTSTLEVSEEEA